jgi:D-alanyl-D-alanine carboxypeptidase
MKKTVISLIVLLFLCLYCINSNCKVVCADYEIESSAVGMVTIEGNTNTLLYSKNAHKKLPMASTTKIITCIVAIENYKDINKKVLVSNRAVGIEGTSIYLKHGEVISFKDLLLGLMLASGNDCAVAIAEERVFIL